MIRRLQCWSSLNRGLKNPTQLSHQVEYFRVRISEPATRGEMKSVHEGCTMCQARPLGTESCARRLYEVVCVNLLLPAALGNRTKQAPRMSAAMLQEIDRLVFYKKALPYFRLWWWHLVQKWCNPSFSDHREVQPSDVR